MRHEGTVFTNQCFQDSLFQSLFWLLVCEGRTGSCRAGIVGKSLFKVPDGMV